LSKTVPRRSLPFGYGGEICISLRTGHFRQAKSRAAVLDEVFAETLERVACGVTKTADLQAILREKLRQSLDDDARGRINRRPGSAVYATAWEPGDKQSATEADLQIIRERLAEFRQGVAENDVHMVLDFADRYLKKHGLPDELRHPLAVGMMETSIRFWEAAERRTLGLEPVVFQPEELPAPPELPPLPPSVGPMTPPKPLASSLIETFGEWGSKSGGWRAGSENQAKVSLGLFLEVCGDKPIDAYTRVDGDAFRTTLRTIPKTYRKSSKDQDKPLKEIIEAADAANCQSAFKRDPGSAFNWDPCRC
jgi:hypothetical protein